jgi:hypothetical protein
MEAYSAVGHAYGVANVAHPRKPMLKRVDILAMTREHSAADRIINVLELKIGHIRLGKRDPSFRHEHHPPSLSVG